MTSSDLHHLAAAYALDALDLAERAHFEAHYQGCDICVADVIDFRAALADVASANPLTPPAALKAKVMAEIKSTRQLSPWVTQRSDQSSANRRQRFTIGVLAVAASLVLAVGAGFIVGRSDTDSYSETASALMERSDTRIVELAGEGAGMFRVAWSPETGQAVVTGDGLPVPAAGQAYELWLIDEAGARPLGLLDVAEDGQIRRVIDVEGSGLQMGVTLEPTSGSLTPTVPILFAAEI